MTATDVRVAAPSAPASRAAVLVLAGQEGWRIARHPFAVVGLVWGVVVGVLLHDNGTRDAFEVVTAAVTFFLGVPVYFAANLVASRDRRAGGGELLAAAPLPERARTAALVAGSLVPFGLALAAVLCGHALLLAADAYDQVPGPEHLLMGPLTVLGGALLGVMVARWFPLPGAAALGMVAMIAWNVAVNNRPESVAPLGTYVTWARYQPHPDWAGFNPGSAWWHLAFLAGLCAMAAIGAFLPGAARRGRVLAAGAAVTALTVALGLVQLP